MTFRPDDSDILQFASEDEVPAASAVQPWKLLIVDDEEEVHRVTRLALSSLTVLERPLELLSAYSGRECVELMRQNPDIAMILLDVVMETEHAGLDAVRAVREQLGNRHVRIILRTGQPGQAPEREVVRGYDINDYKEKTELTATKLFTVVQTGIRLYRELVSGDRLRRGLEQVIESSAQIATARSMTGFQRGVLEQIAALLYAKQDALIASTHAVAAEVRGEGLVVEAGIGVYQPQEGRPVNEVLNEDALAIVNRALDHRGYEIGPTFFAAQFVTMLGGRHVVYLQSDTPFSESDVRLVELFCRNISIALDNLTLNNERADSQRRLILLLGTTIEERSKHLHNHVARVAEYARLIGRKLGLGSEDVEELGVAAAMHDLGKIAIPDAVLDKPGAFTPAERALMETHVIRGEALLRGQNGRLMQTTAAVIGGHHERWDGRGYPRGIRGSDNPLFARITGVADVYDALRSKRTYKEPWTVERTVAYFAEQRGQQFDPDLVDILMQNVVEFEAIREALPTDE